jgi:hypothetical protein
MASCSSSRNGPSACSCHIFASLFLLTGRVNQPHPCVRACVQWTPISSCSSSSISRMNTFQRKERGQATNQASKGTRSKSKQRALQCESGEKGEKKSVRMEREKKKDTCPTTISIARLLQSNFSSLLYVLRTKF